MCINYIDAALSRKDEHEMLLTLSLLMLWISLTKNIHPSLSPGNIALWTHLLHRCLNLVRSCHSAHECVSETGRPAAYLTETLS